MPLGSLLALPLAAWAVYKLGSRAVVLWGTSFYLFFLIMLGVANSGFQLALMVFVFGMMGNIMNISLNTQALGVEHDYGRSILSSFHGLWSFAGFAGAGLGALMVYSGVVPFFHYLIVFAVGLGVVLMFKGSIVREANTKEASGGGLVLKKQDAILLRLGMVGFCGMMCEGCMFDWSGVYMAKVVQPAKQWIPLGYVAFMGAMATGRFIADKLATRWGKITVLKGSGILIFSGLLTSVMLPYFATVVTGFLLVGFGTAAVVPLTYSMAGRSSQYPPGIAIAMISTISFFGFLLGPPLIGFIAELLHLKSSFALIGVMGAMITVLVSYKNQVFALK
jgi:predicted MFS family arabinose efflux permease